MFVIVELVVELVAALSDVVGVVLEVVMAVARLVNNKLILSGVIFIGTTVKSLRRVSLRGGRHIGRRDV